MSHLKDLTGRFNIDNVILSNDKILGLPGCVFNHVQPVFNQFGAARAAYGQIRPNMAIFGSKMAIVGPYGRNVMHTRLNIAPLNISDKFCIKSFCRL